MKICHHSVESKIHEYRVICFPVVSGDLGGEQAGVHPEGRESQPRMETLDRRR